MFLENVIGFYKNLLKNQKFRNRLENAKDSHEYKEILLEAGYNFTQEEFEIATAKILDRNHLEDLDNVFNQLTETELEVIVGGATSYLRCHDINFNEIIVQPMYGVVIDPD